MKNFWHMQLHPGEADWDLKEFDKLLRNFNIKPTEKDEDGKWK